MFNESEERVTTSKRKISSLTGHLRRTKEQLEVLRQEHFGKSSEKDFTEDFDEDIAFPLDDLEVELETKVKGRRPRKMLADIPTEINHHYPIDRTCCTCGCEMASINKWTSSRLQVAPEHVICVQGDQLAMLRAALFISILGDHSMIAV
ncbi:MAG: transposase [Sulfitobacter sp.]